MKKYFAIIALLLYSLQGNAQIFSDGLTNNENFDNKRWSWGYFLGFNTYDLDFDLKEFQPGQAVF